jgi:hypothetical protein
MKEVLSLPFSLIGGEAPFPMRTLPNMDRLCRRYISPT